MNYNKDKNCGTCGFRYLENITSVDSTDASMPITNVFNSSWVCENPKSSKYKEDVSNPNGYCEKWEK